jgi:hypothetical protein
MWFSEPGQGLMQLGELGMAFLLPAFIGLEREVRHKSAGFRTYTLVGLASVLIMLVSKYGFTNVLETSRVVLDPSRIAAQIVTGIGFIGGGLIFVRRTAVRGLTTASCPSTPATSTSSRISQPVARGRRLRRPCRRSLALKTRPAFDSTETPHKAIQQLSFRPQEIRAVDKRVRGSQNCNGEGPSRPHAVRA